MTYIPWVDVVISETQGDGDQVQHSVPLTWRKYISNTHETKPWRTLHLHYTKHIKHEHGTMKNEKAPFFCSVRRGHHRYLEKTFTDSETLLTCCEQLVHISGERGWTYISSRVLLFWHLLSSPPFAASIFLQAYAWKENTWVVVKFKKKTTPLSLIND